MSLLTSLIGTGGGALDPAKSYDGEAAVYSGLPNATANTNKIYLVSTDEGVNQAGFYKSNGSTWLYIGHDYDTLDDIPDGTTNKAYTQTEKTKLGTIESNAINSRNSFTQNSGQYIATEGIRARDIGGTALLNDGGTGGVVVYDSGDVDIRHFGRAYGEVMGNFAKIVCETAGTYNVLIFGDRKDEIAMKDFNKYGIEYEKKKGVKNVT